MEGLFTHFFLSREDKALVITFFLIAAIIFFAKFLTQKKLQFCSYLIAITLLFSELLGFVHLKKLGLWTLANGLPLHMCDLTLIAGAFFLFSRQQFLYEFLLYWGFCGALTALVFPNLVRGDDLFMLINYYLTHGGIILTALWATFALRYKPRKGSILQVFLYSQILIPLVGGLNWLLGTNYMFMRNLDGIDSPIPINIFPYHFILIELCGLLGFFCVYLPFYVKRKFFSTEFNEKLIV